MRNRGWGPERRGRAWLIDVQGCVHFPGRRGYTYCRQSTQGMAHSRNGHLCVSCVTCQRLLRETNVNPWEETGYRRRGPNTYE